MKVVNKLLILLMLAVPFVGCSDDDDVAVTDITLNKTSLSLGVGETFPLVATVAPDDATDKTIIWKSVNDAVATVSDAGVVTAVSKGTVNISAMNGAVTAVCSVTVTEEDYADIIKGSYSGSITVPVVPEPITGAIINVNYKSQNTVTLKLNQTLMTGVKVDIEGDVTVGIDGDNYTITGKIPSFKLNDNTMTNEVSVAGTIDKNGNAKIDIDLTVPVIGALKVAFDGKKQ